MDSDAFKGLIVLAIVVAIYFVPTTIAFARGHHYKWVIFAINLIAGWTILAYFAAFAWAVWPRQTSLTDPFHGDPVTRNTESGRRIYERRGEYQQSADAGEQWYYSRNGQVEGPVARNMLLGMALKGEVKPIDLVWKEGMSGWATASQVLKLPSGTIPQLPRA